MSSFLRMGHVELSHATYEQLTIHISHPIARVRLYTVLVRFLVSFVKCVVVIILSCSQEGLELSDFPLSCTALDESCSVSDKTTSQLAECCGFCGGKGEV